MRFGWVEWLDSQMFRAATYLLPEPLQVDDIEIISFAENLGSDPESLNQLAWLISKLDKSNASAISLIMQPLPSLDYQLTESPKAKPAKERDKWQPSQSGLSHLAQVLARHNVQLGITVFGSN